MIHFDEVLEQTRSIIDLDPDSAQIQDVTVLRDLRGRIRLFLKPVGGDPKVLTELIARIQPRLESELGGFWGKLITPDVPNNDMVTLLNSVRKEASSIDQAGFEKWSIIERHISKSSWLQRSGNPPWELHEKTPAIVSFFSHKGGVGRTTTLCAAAINLARKGHRVVVIDLDLEAPGISSLLSGASSSVGVVDYLLERLLEHKSRFGDFVSIQNDQDLIGGGGEPIHCLAAGTITDSYIEKLSRLDYELFVNVSADKNPMISLFKEIKASLSPSFILLDCRAGLHDLGGLALQRLSHLNVIFGLDSEQSWQGLRMVVRQIGQSERVPDCLIIQALEPPPGDIRRKSRERFLEDSWNAFSQYYYDAEAVPDIDNADAPHYPFHIPYDSSLAGYQSLADVAEILAKERFREFTEMLARRVGKKL